MLIVRITLHLVASVPHVAHQTQLSALGTVTAARGPRLSTMPLESVSQNKPSVVILELSIGTSSIEGYLASLLHHRTALTGARASAAMHIHSCDGWQIVQRRPLTLGGTSLVEWDFWH